MSGAGHMGPTIALTGAGRMGGALLSGWIASGTEPSDVLIIDPNPGEAAQEAIKNGAHHASALTAENSAHIEIVLLGIKPQMFETLGPDMAAALPKSACIISILAGTTQARLQAIFAGHPIIRAMPNTPAAIGQGITAFHCSESVRAAQAERAQALLSAGGAVYRVDDEGLIDTVTAISGSGPAYLFHMVEALEAAAIRLGMPEDMAPHFARQTVIGAGALLADSEQSATDLRRAVTSPNGTTQAALDVLMDELPELIRRTTAAAYKRSKDLGLE